MAVRLVTAVSIAAGSFALVGTSAHPAAAETPFTFTHQQFDGTSFPPTDWKAPTGTWSQQCSPAPTPAIGCSALATVTSPDSSGDQTLLYNPPTGIPGDLVNPTLTFYSDFTPDASSTYNSIYVQQSRVQGTPSQYNDGDPTIATLTGPGGDTPNSQVLHTIPLTRPTLPLIFRWHYSGAASATPVSTWAISDVTISGTVPSASYALTANPVDNTTYPAVKAGRSVTIGLSGSSNPVGDSLGFAITQAPTHGTLGPVTTVDATHSQVTYTPPLDACPDTSGVASYICTDSFSYVANDLSGNTSPPARVSLDIHPGGPGTATVTVAAPTTSRYQSLTHNGVPQQAAVLSSQVSVGPTSFPDAIEVKVQASTGAITLSNLAASGVTVVDGTSSPGRQINFQGSVAKVNAALSELFLYPDSGTPPATITVLTYDLGANGQGPQVAGATATISVTSGAAPVVPKPTISLPAGPLSIAANNGTLAFPTGTATGVSVSDGGATAGTRDTVLLSVTGGRLAVPPADTAGASPLVTASGTDGTLQLTGTLDNLNQALTDLTFDPSGLTSSVVTLTGTVQDPDTTLASTTQQASITVTAAPYAYGVTDVSTLANIPVTPYLCADGPSGDKLSITVTGQPIHGSFVADPTANASTSGCSQSTTTLIVGYRYTPDPDYVGPDTATYTIHDATTGLTSSSYRVAFVVNAHVKPTATDASATTTQDQPVRLTVCAENPDPAPVFPLTFVVNTAPTFGGVTDDGAPVTNPCNGPNQQARSFTYSPNPGSFTSNGSDSFTYVVSNGASSAPATVTISVTTRTPQVIAQAVSVDEDSSVAVRLCSTLPLVALTTHHTAPAHGTLDSLPAAGQSPACPSGLYDFGHLRYVPNYLFEGSDSFTYSATDGSYTSAPATISITVKHVEIAPSVGAQTVTALAHSSTAITLAGTSVQGQPLTYRIISPPHAGSLAGTTPDVIYTPSITDGADSFTYVANDGVADSAPATVTINVITPRLSSSVCLPSASAVGNDRYACAAQLSTVPDDGNGTGYIAHTDGTRYAQLHLEATVTNPTAIGDTVTITGPAGTAGWGLQYDNAGQVVTDQVIGAGLSVTLPAGGSTAVIIVVNAPGSYNSAASEHLTLLATSGNSAAVSTALPVTIQDGASSPALSLSQRDGSGATTFPGYFMVAPVLVAGGPVSGLVVVPDMVGTGRNTMKLKAESQDGPANIGVSYLVGTRDITALVRAGTFQFDCYGAGGCPQIAVRLTPGTGAGHVTELVTETSSLDGQSSFGYWSASQATQVGPDLSTSLPSNGVDVTEATPVTQTASIPVQVLGTVSKVLHLHNTSDTALDTFTVSVAADGPGSVSVSGFPAGTVSLGTGKRVIGSSAPGPATYLVTLGAGDYADLTVTDIAGAIPGVAGSHLVVTASSGVDRAKTDSYAMSFPTYSLAPSVTVPTADWSVGPGNTTIPLAVVEKGVGTSPVGDSTVITGPAISGFFAMSYQMAGKDVTADVTGTGLAVTLAPNGGAPQAVNVTASVRQGAPVGAVAYVTVVARSLNALPAGVSASARFSLFNGGASQLQFIGLPQAEPTDITQGAAKYFPSRVAPLAMHGADAVGTFGAYNDPAGNKFVYVSGNDTFTMRLDAGRASATAYKVMVAGLGDSRELPAWARFAFNNEYYSNREPLSTTNPLGSDGLHPTFTANGQDVTAAVLAGTYMTDKLRSDNQLDLKVSFTAPPGDARRYQPMKFTLVNAATGETEDAFDVEPSTIISCASNSDAQILATGINHGKLSFRADTRDGSAVCLGHLSTGWVTQQPVVFSSYTPASGQLPAGGDDPKGLWLVPQDGATIRIDASTLDVTSQHVRGYVDTPVLGADGLPAPTTTGYLFYANVGDYPQLDWHTQDGTNGLKVTQLAPSPFPLVKPDNADWPNNTMDAARYFQVQTNTGAPALVGEMAVNTPWYHASVPLIQTVDNSRGVSLAYAAPANVVATLPGDSTISNYGMFWVKRQDGKIIQGGCLGLPAQFFKLVDISSAYCPVEATTVYGVVPSDPNQTASIESVTFALKVVGVQLGTSEFNLKTLSGHVDFVPGTNTVAEVVLDANFGVGPPTACSVAAKARTVTTLTNRVEGGACPSNYFFYDAVVTFTKGGFTTASANTGYGIKFVGTLSLMNIATLNSIEADVSTAPFNFHFVDSPIDLSIDVGVPLAARVSLSGDIGAGGFDIALDGSISVFGQTLASASGIISTKGFGLCAGLLGTNVGLGDMWGESPSFYPSGCTTSQFRAA